MLSVNKTIRPFMALILAAGLVLAGSAVSRAGQPSLDDKIGQMLMFGFLGSKPEDTWARRTARQIKSGQIGGVVFLGHNFRSRSGVKGLTNLFRRSGKPLLPFIALDMEGGFVQRLGPKLGYEKVAPAQTIAATMSAKAAGAKFGKLASITASAGFNVNLGPVVDLLVNRQNPVVGKWKRSYGANPDKVTAYARQFVAAHRKRGVLTVLKHFPGHGSSRTDSHDGFVDISQTWSKKELQPFQKLIISGHAPAIMPGHLIVKRSGGKPVSLSKSIIAGTLRNKLRYRGLVISDDLQMSAIRKNFSYKTALVLAINAGVDVLMISNSAKPDPDMPKKTINLIKQAIKNKQISKRRIDSAYNRILAAKKRLRR